MAGELAALEYKDRFNVVSVRPPGVYGPGDREILTFFQTVNRRIKPYLGDINRKLQLVHVDDLCDGIYAAVKANTQSGSIYFICEKTAYRFAELIDHIQAALGKRAVPLWVPAGLFRIMGGVSEFVFRTVNATPMLTREKAEELLASWEIDASRARMELGWESNIPFPQGAQETVDWYRREGWL
jgi:nucleoside-diphosphate-sugar epimerase